MVRSVLVLCLVASLASADDAPRMYQPPSPGETVGYPNWVLTPEGKQRLDDTLNRQLTELTILRAENGSLKISLAEMEAKPALTVKGVLILISVGFVLGAGATATIAAIAR